MTWHSASSNPGRSRSPWTPSPGPSAPTSRSPPAPQKDVTTTLVMWALILAGIVAGRAVCNYISTIAFAKTGVKVVTRLRTRVFDHIQSLSLQYHSRASIGDTSQRLVGDMGRLQEVAVTAGLPLIGNLATVVVLFIVVMVLNPVLSLVVVATAALYLLISSVAAPQITAASRATRKGEGRLVGDAAEALAAIRVVQAYGLEDTIASSFAAGNQKRTDRQHPRPPPGRPPGALHRRPRRPGHRRGPRLRRLAGHAGHDDPRRHRPVHDVPQDRHETPAGHGQVHRPHRPRPGQRRTHRRPHGRTRRHRRPGRSPRHDRRRGHRHLRPDQRPRRPRPPPVHRPQPHHPRRPTRRPPRPLRCRQVHPRRIPRTPRRR
ncbi:ABC transporter transmembrane domain-containing protein [Corynebacterium suedekumii]|nr:ABC transporter transmembrane domain-containing protein [Corynebacterium suedekumii]